MTVDTPVCESPKPALDVSNIILLKRKKSFNLCLLFRTSWSCQSSLSAKVFPWILYQNWLSLILEKRFVVLEYLPAAFEQVWMCSLLNYWLH